MTTTGSTASKPSFRSRWTKPFWSLHRWLGLLFAVPLLLVSLSGALLVRYDWIERGFDRTVFRAAPATNAAPLKTIIAQLAQNQANAQVRFLECPGDPGRNLVFSVHGPGVRRAIIADAVTGDTLLERDELAGPRRWLFRFHESLLLGKTGELMVAISALVLLASSLTGLWIYRGAVTGLFRFPRWRGRSMRLLAGAWHRWVGVTSLVLLLIWALTGAWLTLPALPGLFAAERPSPPPQPVYDWNDAPAIEPILVHAREKFPPASLDFLSLPRQPEDDFVLTLVDRQRWFWNKFVEVTYDGRTGEFRESKAAADGDWLMKLNMLAVVLHFGHLGGALMKWLWLVFGFAPALLAGSGALIWWRRQRR
jgi:uncharacterized iron-regulated membrane protein